MAEPSRDVARVLRGAPAVYMQIPEPGGELPEPYADSPARRAAGYAPAAGAHNELRLRELWETIRRHRWLALGVAALVTGLVAANTFRQPRIYASASLLRVDEEDRGAQILAEMPVLAGARRGKLETEMVVLRSWRIAERVADSLDLHVQLMEPARPRSEVLRPLHADASAPRGVYTLEHRGGGRYSVSAEGTDPGLRLPGTVQVGAPFRIGAAELLLEPALRASPPEVVRFAVSPFRNAVDGVRAQLDVARPDPDAFVVSVRYASSDPQLAAAVPNVAVATFLQYKSTSSKSEAQSTVTFLREQVRTYEDELRRAENELRGFREANQVVSPTDEASQQVRRLADLQAERDRLRTEREALAGLLGRVRASQAADGPSPYRQLASFPTFLGNRAVQDMLQSLTALENERSTLLVRRQEGNLDVQGITTRIAQIETQLYDIAVNYLASLDSQIGSTQGVLGRFGTDLERIPGREVEFARLQRQQELLANMYTLLQTRLKEAEIREAVEPGDTRVIDEALVPEHPVSPRPVRSTVLGAMLGIMLGIGAAFAKQALDTKVRSKEDVEAATFGSPILGAIPRIRTTQQGALSSRNGMGKTGAVVSVSAGSMMVEERLSTLVDPHSPASEAYRALRTSILFSSATHPPQVLVLTSAMPGDGKSTSAANLAITLAQQGTRTLLVDADLRRAVLHQVFGQPQEPGLTHVLLGRATLDDAVRQVPAGSGDTVLHLLPSGVLPPNPAEILGSPSMRTLLQRLRQEFEVIIFDAPPLNLVTDAAVLGTSADATILVTRAGITDKRALHHAATQLFNLGAHIGGIVLNDVDAAGGSYYGYGYGYGYGGYSARTTKGTKAGKS